MISFNNNRTGRNKAKPINDINITPLVDVMLVLLIVFMVSAPLISVGVNISLPKTDARTLKGSDKVVTVSIKQNGQLYIQNTKVGNKKLITKLKAIAKYNNTIYVRADGQIKYNKVMWIMGRLNRAGFKQVVLVALPMD